MVGIHLFPEPSPGVTPQLIASNTILQLSTVELEQAIIRELDENPALEMLERPDCPVCGGKLFLGTCLRCSGVDFTMQSSSLSSSADFRLSEADWSTHDALEDQDPLGFVADPLTLAERLLAQLRLVLPEEDHDIAMYVVGNLDEHGYLSITTEELAKVLDSGTTRIEAVVNELQNLEPAGIGARNLEECLLLQLGRLTEQGITPPLITRKIILHHLTELGHHQFEHIHSALNASRAEVEDAFFFIRTNLHPYPAYHYFAVRGSPPIDRELLVPSVLIHRSANVVSGYEVEVVESQRFLLSFNPAYQHIRQQPELVDSPAELEHVSHFLERARLFMRQIRRRSFLLHKLMYFLVDYQRDFLDYGALRLRPLSQKTVAQKFSVHVSTISRAIANKYAQLPSRELIPLHRFFSGELRVQEIIRQIITHEKEPLSDAAVARLLSEHGVTLSRQMVANHRAELGIPAARQRAILMRKQREAK